MIILRQLFCEYNVYMKFLILTMPKLRCLQCKSCKTIIVSLDLHSENNKVLNQSYFIYYSRVYLNPHNLIVSVSNSFKLNFSLGTV